MIVQVRNISEILRNSDCVGACVWANCALKRTIKLYSNYLWLRESIEVRFLLIGIPRAEIIIRDALAKTFDMLTFSEKSQLIGPPAMRPCNVHALFSSTDDPAPPRSP